VRNDLKARKEFEIMQNTARDYQDRLFKLAELNYFETQSTSLSLLKQFDTNLIRPNKRCFQLQYFIQENMAARCPH
jgi:hypothetical protein